MAVYLDCAATSPLDPRVQEEVIKYLSVEFGNAGSRHHAFGQHAKKAVEKARSGVAAVVDATRGEVIFTSGATESNNLAILGLAAHGKQVGKTHIVSTQIEHRSVLEPLEMLSQQGFKVTLVRPESGGQVQPQTVLEAVHDDTLLVSVMQVNNETGILQPIEEISRLLGKHSAYFHVDAAQGFGKEIGQLLSRRIDLISISGHKIYAPKGVGALVMRRRNGQRPPLVPLMYGGGQELGLRPGTLPVHLIVGLGKAAELALEECDSRSKQCRKFKKMILEKLKPLNPIFNGDLNLMAPHMINLAFRDISSEEAIEALNGVVAISNGSACTSTFDSCSHVLSAMRLDEHQVDGALRLSWCHVTDSPDWAMFIEAIKKIREEVRTNSEATADLQ